MLSLLTAFLMLGALWVLPAQAQAASVMLAWASTNPTGTGIQFYRCTGVGDTDCVPTLPLAGGAMAASLGQWRDLSVSEGIHYCWSATATRTNGPPSVQSNIVCTTLAFTTLSAPTNLRIVPPGTSVARKARRHAPQ